MFDAVSPAVKTLSTIRIEHINAQSLLGHFDEIELLIKERNIDILCISETWLHQEISSSFISIPNFHIYRCDAGRGGGVCIYVRDTLKSNKISSTAVNDTAVEDIWVTVQSNMHPSILVGTIYRHPHATAESFEYLENIFREMSLKRKPLFILGDLNDDLNKTNAKLTGIINRNKLKQLVNKPTRITVTTSSILDVIITNSPDIILHTNVIPCPIADHELLTLILNIEKPKRQPVTKTSRDLTHYDPKSLCEHIANESSLLDILATDNVDRQIATLTEVIKNSINASAPIKTKTVKRPPAPWIDDNIKRAINDRNNTQKALKINRSDTTLQAEYKHKKRNVKTLIHSAKTNYFKSKINECRNDSAETWKLVKKLVPNKKQNTDISTNSINDIEHFNNFFAEVGRLTYEQTIAPTHLRNISEARPKTNIFRPQPVGLDTIIVTVKQLRKTNSVGADGIAQRFINDSLPAIAYYLTVIINTSIVTGVYPSLWKHGIITPIYKSGDTDEINNYRPITILPVISKVLEKIAANQLTAFLEENNLISNTQHGFRSKLSTETALLKITNEIYNNIDNNQINLLTLCDLSKAFDSVSHEILLNKLTNHGIDNFWCKDCLSARTQSVKIHEKVSSKKQVSFGVPQGSILGPILFTIFINDLSSIAKDCLLIQYADDSQFLHAASVNNLNELIGKAKQTLTEAKQYFEINGLKLNPQKTQCIFIGSRQNIAKIPIDTMIEFQGCYIKPSTTVKNLGVYIDRYMTFETHIDHIYWKVMGTLIYLNHIKNKIPTETRIIVIQTLALSIINYCLNIWGSTNKTQIQRTQKLQNFAARVALGNINKYDHITPHINTLKWLKVQQKYNYDTCILIHKIIHGIYPHWLLPIRTTGNTTGVQTRQNNCLYIKRSNTETGARNMLIRGLVTWNQLPENVRNISNQKTFKTKVKEHLLKYQ